jgi:sporulation protein YlmC with PRC-barrel domain
MTKKFATELRGKTVMTNDGRIIGMIENFVVDTEPRLYQTDSQGRLILPFTSMRSVRDVVVMSVE